MFNDKKMLSRFSIFSALFLGLLLGIALFCLQKIEDSLRYYLIFSISAILTVAVLNWRLLSHSWQQSRRYWLVIVGMLALGLGTLWLNLLPIESVDKTPFFDFMSKKQNGYLFFFLLQAVMVFAFFLSFFSRNKEPIPIDEKFNTSTHQFIFNSLIYIGFLLLLTVILVLGFGLIRLLGWDLWRWLGDFGQTLVVGLVLGSNLLFLNLLPAVKEQSRPPAFLFIFPSLILGFVGVYFLALPFQTDLASVIDSGIRLSTAGILWLFLLYLNDTKRQTFNVIASAAGLILTIASLRGLYIRITEYGLTLDRIYAQVVIAALFCGHGFIFLKSLAVKRLPRFSAHCLPLMMGVLGALFLLTTFIPAIRWSLESQITRYTTGGANLKNFRKYDFERFGAAGKEALAKVRAYHQDNPQFLAKIEDFGKTYSQIEQEKIENILAQMTLIPADLQLSEKMTKKLRADLIYANDKPQPIIALATDANHDGKNEILIFVGQPTKNTDEFVYSIYFFPDSQSTNQYWEKDIGIFKQAALLQALQAGHFDYQKPHFDGLKIEGLPQIDFPHFGR